MFDALATVPGLANQQSFDTYWLKLFRIVHLVRLTEPLLLLMKYLLKNYSKKRQNDISYFACLILIVIYTNHISACIWLYLGKMWNCEVMDVPRCTDSWTY
jgi:hypothetical protein